MKARTPVVVRLARILVIAACLAAVHRGAPDARAQLVENKPLDEDYFLNGKETLKAFAAAAEAGLRSTVLFVRNERVFVLGTVVDERGYIVTKASEFESGEPFQIETPSGERFDGEIIDKDPTDDIALARIPSGKVPPVTWQETGGLLLGQWVASPGWRAKELRVGIVSAKRRKIERRGGVLGIGLDPNDDAEELGVGIDEVFRNGPAAKVGLLKGDLVVAIEDEKIHSRKDLAETVAAHDPGDTLKLTIERGEENITLWATLEHRSKVFDPFDRNQQMSGHTSVRKAGFSDIIQTDLPLEPEGMGSPLVDIFGNVLGINIAKFDRVTTYSLPSELVRKVIADLIPAQSAPVKRSVPAEDTTGN